MVRAEDDSLGKDLRNDERHSRVTGLADRRHHRARRGGDGGGHRDGCCRGGLLRGTAAGCHIGGADDAGDGHAGGRGRYCHGGCW